MSQEILFTIRLVYLSLFLRLMLEGSSGNECLYGDECNVEQNKRQAFVFGDGLVCSHKNKRCKRGECGKCSYHEHE